MNRQEILKLIYEMAQKHPYYEGFEREFETFTKHHESCPRCASKSNIHQIIGIVQNCHNCKFIF